MKKRVKSISIKIPLSKIIRSFRRENHLHLPLVRPLHRDNKIVACLVRRGMGQNTSKRGYLFQTQPFQITRLFRHEHFRISFEETGFHPSKPVPGRKLSGVGRCNGFGRNLSVRTTYDVEIDRVAW